MHIHTYKFTSVKLNDVIEFLKLVSSRPLEESTEFSAMEADLTCEILPISWQGRLAVASAALMTYDIVCQIPKELSLVWRRQWGLPTALYLLTRYGVLIHSCGALAIGTSFSFSTQNCELAENFNYEYWSQIGSWSIPCVVLLSEALLTLRVGTLWKGNRFAIIFLWGMYMLSLIASLAVGILQYLAYNYVYEFYKSVESGVPPIVAMNGDHGWLFAAVSGFSVTLWVPGLVMETTLVVATVWKAYDYKKKGHQGRLIHVMIRDGLLYFVCVFVIMLLNTCMCAMPVDPLFFAAPVELSLCTIALLASRIFLNLRATAYTDVVDPAGGFHNNATSAPASSVWAWDIESLPPRGVAPRQENAPETEAEK